MKGRDNIIKQLDTIKKELSDNTAEESLGVVDILDNPRETVFNLLEIKDGGILENKDYANKFFKLIGIDSIKKENNSIRISLQARTDKNLTIPNFAKIMRIILGGHGHTDYERCGSIFEDIDNNNKISLESNINNINSEIANAVLIRYGLVELLDKSKFVDNPNNRVDFFVPAYVNKDFGKYPNEKDYVNDTMRFLNDYVKENRKNINFYINREGEE